MTPTSSAGQNVPAIYEGSRTLTTDQVKKLNNILVDLCELHPLVDTTMISTYGLSGWFREYTKSDTWRLLDSSSKEAAWACFEALTNLLTTINESCDAIFPNDTIESVFELSLQSSIQTK